LCLQAIADLKSRLRLVIVGEEKQKPAIEWLVAHLLRETYGERVVTLVVR